MKQIFDFLKLTLIGGALVVLPVWLALLLFFKALLQVRGVVKPISAGLPHSLAHPQIIAGILLMGLCFLVGLAIRTVAGRQAQRIVETTVLKRIPGYAVLRNVAEQMADIHSDHGFQPALVEVSDALAPAFVVEKLASGKCTIFLPSAPTPLTGSILIIDAARVHPIDVSVPEMFSCISKWGNGAGELLAKMHGEKSPPISGPA